MGVGGVPAYQGDGVNAFHHAMRRLHFLLLAPHTLPAPTPPRGSGSGDPRLRAQLPVHDEQDSNRGMRPHWVAGRISKNRFVLKLAREILTFSPAPLLGYTPTCPPCSGPDRVPGHPPHQKVRHASRVSPGPKQDAFKACCIAGYILQNSFPNLLNQFVEIMHLIDTFFFV